MIIILHHKSGGDNEVKSTKQHIVSLKEKIESATSIGAAMHASEDAALDREIEKTGQMEKGGIRNGHILAHIRCTMG